VIRQLRPATVALIVFTLVTGIAYPLAVTALAQLVLPGQADGSLVEVHGAARGSALLAQPFEGAHWFHPRPSATGYDATTSGATNLAPTNPELLATIRARANAYRRENELPPEASVPVDAVTASGSGLDPEISEVNARLQAPRVARSWGLPLDEVLAVVQAHTSARSLGVLGQPRVDVVEVNADLARLGA
jgi:potassium-transporting ATPase KdpC subunit